MTKYFIHGCLSAVIMCAVSCSSDYPDIPSQGMSGNLMDQDKLYSMLEQYYVEVHPSTRTSLPGFRITEVRSQSYSVANVLESDSISLPTRATEEPDFTVQTVCMDFGDTSGYAVVSDDERLERVFFFTENGEPSDTTFIAPLQDLIESVPVIAADMILNDDNVSQTRGTVTTYVIEDIVKFHWGQGYPFNNAMPTCECAECFNTNGHKPAGCVTTAVAQYLAKRGNFKGSYYPNDISDFYQFPSKYYEFSLSQARQIANYFLEIAQNCQIEFKCGGSGSTVDAVVNYLKEIGINCSIPSTGFGTNQIIASLASEIPLIMSGRNAAGKGHMWLVTGVIYKTDQVTGLTGNRDFYCNWGWNSKSDGWTIGDYYTPQDRSPYSKNIQIIYTYGW